jgi:hypothetical protein
VFHQLVVPRMVRTRVRLLCVGQVIEERDAELQANEVTIAGLRAELEQCRSEARAAASARIAHDASQEDTIRRLTQEAAEAEVGLGGAALIL